VGAKCNDKAQGRVTGREPSLEEFDGKRQDESKVPVGRRLTASDKLRAESLKILMGEVGGKRQRLGESREVWEVDGKRDKFGVIL
jgi:hypothetical protein